MVEILAESWRQSNPEGVKLFHIATEGWIDKSLTCDGLHPTAEGMLKVETPMNCYKYLSQDMRR
jgi:hypothetical protein